jgi:hypothetical protein
VLTWSDELFPEGKANRELEAKISATGQHPAVMGDGGFGDTVTPTGARR